MTEAVLDDPKVGGMASYDETGMVIPLRSLPGARSVREVYGPGEAVPDHCHHAVTLTIPLVGAFTTLSDLGEATIVGAAAVLHPAGSRHAALIADEGLEAVGFELEVEWLRRIGLSRPVDRTFCWRGGKAGAAAAALARQWMDPAGKVVDLGTAILRFLSAARSEPAINEPGWISHVDAALRAERPLSVRALARDLDLHPAWLLQAYRAARGEGLRQSLRRKRVEAAVRLLRETALPLAQIACHAGFCDQSHMNRNFRAVIGRSPLQVGKSVRADRISPPSAAGCA